ncbi:MAG: hypothetical protein ACD_46C00262G0006 [uncultured bacterium]|nr:MAG: hypothetical protein ACD_46C00262G0006 [uncultured bacterium]
MDYEIITLPLQMFSKLDHIVIQSYTILGRNDFIIEKSNATNVWQNISNFFSFILLSYATTKKLSTLSTTHFARSLISIYL